MYEIDMSKFKRIRYKVDHKARGKNVIVFEYEGKPWVDSIEK